MSAEYYSGFLLNRNFCGTNFVDQTENCRHENLHTRTLETTVWTSFFRRPDITDNR